MRAARWTRGPRRGARDGDGPGPARPGPAPGGGVDLREALDNDRAVGTAAQVQLPHERITRLDGLVLDLDPGLLLPGNPLFPPAADPAAFLAAIAPALDRHPLLRDAEVRSSGTGLHAILRLGPAVELETAAEQHRWAAIVRAVQATLPADPKAPGITALTRPVGSANGKNGAVVARLRDGTPVDPARVEAYVARLAAAPFRVVAEALLGSDRVSPCPACRKPGSALGVRDHAGHCYGCHTVSLARLFDAAFRPEAGPAAAVKADGGGPRRPSPRRGRPVAFAPCNPLRGRPARRKGRAT